MAKKLGNMREICSFAWVPRGILLMWGGSSGATEGCSLPSANDKWHARSKMVNLYTLSSDSRCLITFSSFMVIVRDYATTWLVILHKRCQVHEVRPASIIRIPAWCLCCRWAPWACLRRRTNSTCLVYITTIQIHHVAKNPSWCAMNVPIPIKAAASYRPWNAPYTYLWVNAWAPDMNLLMDQCI